MQTILFSEEQRFRQIWVWVSVAIGAVSLLPLWYGVYQQLVEGEPWGNNPGSDETLLLITTMVTLLVLGILLLLWNARLLVSIGMEGIEYRFTPFHRKMHEIRWSEVAKVYVRTYRPIIEYGGWGIRFGPSGKAYNVSGTEGLQVELANGKRILFGTERRDEISSVLEQIKR